MSSGVKLATPVLFYLAIYLGEESVYVMKWETCKERPIGIPL